MQSGAFLFSRVKGYEVAKTKFIHVMVNQDHYKQINQEALRVGVSVSELIRVRVLNSEEITIDETKEKGSIKCKKQEKRD